MFLNVLIRTNNRPNGFLKQMILLEKQIPDCVIVSVHNDFTKNYVLKYLLESKLNIKIIEVQKSSSSPFFYNLFYNDLILAANEGFVWCIDDDDEIAIDAIEYIKHNCTDENTLYFLKMLIHKTKIVPSTSWNKQARINDIGTPNFVIHHSLAKTELWTDEGAGDGTYILKLFKKYKTIWLDKIVYTVFQSNRGKGELITM